MLNTHTRRLDTNDGLGLAWQVVIVYELKLGVITS